eukprot:g67659.t1
MMSNGVPMADAVVAKAFSRIDAVFDALSSPDVSHQISYHILSSTLPSYLMHTLRITPPAILLPILTDFISAFFAPLLTALVFVLQLLTPFLLIFAVLCRFSFFFRVV